MLKDLTRADWLNILGLPESRIPAALIVRGTRNFRSKYRAMLPHFDNVLEVGTPNGIIEEVLVGDVGGRPVGFACAYGASMASEVAHIFGALGTRAVTQIGNCGALADGLGAGDLFVAARAYCGEGAARYHKADAAWVEASTSLLRSRALSELRPGECRSGAVYTTAALFAEGGPTSSGGTARGSRRWTWRRPPPTRWPSTLAWTASRSCTGSTTRAGGSTCS